MIAFYNGEFIHHTEKVVALEDRGYHFGDGVYEVIRVYQGSPFMLKEHIQRLHNSAEALNIEMNYNDQQLISFMEEGISRLGESDVDVYLQVTRGSAPRNHIYKHDILANTSMIFRKSKQVSKDILEHGGKVILLEDERWANCYIKSLNLLPNIIAKNEAAKKGCVEAVLVKNEVVTEASASNVFIVKNGTVYTTPLNKGILPGITRIAVLKLAKELSIEMREEFFSPLFLKDADEMFITSTTSEILPITKVDDEPIGDGNVGEVTKKLYKSFQQLKRNG
jgi:D-alanine transaminase